LHWDVKLYDGLADAMVHFYVWFNAIGSKLFVHFRSNFQRTRCPAILSGLAHPRTYTLKPVNPGSFLSEKFQSHCHRRSLQHPEQGLYSNPSLNALLHTGGVAVA